MHFGTSLDCDVLAGERGPSFTDVSQIKNWKVIHVRFIETCPSETFDLQSHKSEPLVQESTRVKESTHAKEVRSARVPKSVSLSQMLKLGKVINPETDVVTLRVEEFSIAEGMSWLEPIEVTMSVQRKPFADGAFRDAYMAKVS